MSNPINRQNYNLTDSIIRQTEKINSINRANPVRGGSSQKSSFQELFNHELHKNLSFSKHASLRTAERNIQITQMDLNQLDHACEKANQKGIRDALIVMNDAAFIVNAPNKVVVTVLDKNEMKNNVFTNIDGALFL